MAKISIVIPVYKVGKYIENSMTSVCNQTYRDFEVVLVDNNSPDDSIETAERVLKEGSIEFRVVKQTIQGLPSARNMGIREARGEWIVSIDPDDTIAPSFLEVLLNESLKHQTDAIFSNYGDVPEGLLFDFPEEHVGIETIVYERENALMEVLQRRLPLMVSNMFFKKDFFINANLHFDEDVILGADLILVWQLLLSTDKIVCIKNILYNHFVREDSLMTAPSVKKIESNLNGYKRIQPILAEKHSKELSSWVYAREVFALVRTCCIHGTKRDFIENSKRFYTQEVYNSLKTFPDKKIKNMNKVIKISPSLYYSINRIFKNPDSLLWRKIVGRMHK